MDPFLLIDQAVDAYRSARSHHTMMLHNTTDPLRVADAKAELLRTARDLHTIMEITTLSREE